MTFEEYFLYGFALYWLAVQVNYFEHFKWRWWAELLCIALWPAALLFGLVRAGRNYLIYGEFSSPEPVMED